MKRVFENTGKTALLERCILDVSLQLEERPEIIVFKKICKQQRPVGFFSDDSAGYKYSNKLMPSQPLSANLIELISTINNVLGTKFNGMLV